MKFKIVISAQLITSFTLFLSYCTEDLPTNIGDDPITVDTIPLSMTQTHIPWASLADSPWPMYSHDPQGTKRSRFPGPLLGEVEWQRWTDGVQRQYGFTAFSIGPDSTIYYGSSYEKPPGSGQTWVFYARSKSGDLKWTFRDSLDYSAEMICAPIITNNDEIIFATPSYGTYVNLYKLDFSGNLIWKFRYEGSDYIPDNLNIGLDGTIYFIDGDRNLAAISSDGELRWVKSAGANFKGNEIWALAISTDGNTLYVPGAYGFSELYAIDLNGEIVWEFNTPDSSARATAQPMVDNQGNIYVAVKDGIYPPDSSIAGLYSLNPDGVERWKFPKSTSGDRYTIGLDGHIYICDGEELFAVGYNGEELWRQALQSYQYSPILIDNNGTVFLPGAYFQAIDSENGTTLWSLDLPTTGWQGAAIGYDNRLVYGYARSDSNKFVIGIK